MVFENNGIDIESLPKAEDLSLTSIERNYHWVILFNHILRLIPAVIFVFAKIGDTRSFWLSLILIVTIVYPFVSYFLAYKSFINRAYGIRKHDIIYRSGWFTKETTIYPISRIQYCSVKTGIFSRIFGLSSVSLYTAGGEDGELTIDGLTEENAEKIRHFILEKVKQQDAEE